jgi:hypothetical protein
MLGIFETRILRRIYGPIKENGIWRSRRNQELYKLYNEPDKVKVIKIWRMRWLGQLFRTQKQNPCRKLTLHKAEGTRRVDRPAVRWLDSAEEDVKTMDVANWRRKSQDRDQWPKFIMDCSAHRRR